MVKDIETLTKLEPSNATITFSKTENGYKGEYTRAKEIEHEPTNFSYTPVEWATDDEKCHLLLKAVPDEMRPKQ